MTLRLQQIDLKTDAWDITTSQATAVENGQIKESGILVAPIDAVTTESGEGSYDVLMAATKTHLQEEYQEDRITGQDYAEVFLGSLSAILETSVDFLVKQQETNKINAEIGLARQKTVSDLANTDDSTPVGLGFNHIPGETVAIPAIDCFGVTVPDPPCNVVYAPGVPRPVDPDTPPPVLPITSGTYYPGSGAGASSSYTYNTPDSPVFLASFWLLLEEYPVTYDEAIIICGDESNPGSYGFSLSVSPVGKLRAHTRINNGTHPLDIYTVNSIPKDGEYHHCLVAINMTTGDVQIYIDDVDQAYTGTVTAGFDLYLNGQWALSGSPGSSSSRYLKMHISEVWFNTEYLDIDVDTNRRKFITAGGTHVDLTIYPTGIEPLWYAPDGNPTLNLGAYTDVSVSASVIPSPFPMG